jgi:hypothetical protein
VTGMGRWRVAALILAVMAFGPAGLWPPTWLPESFRLQAGRTALFWLGGRVLPGCGVGAGRNLRAGAGPTKQGGE